MPFECRLDFILHKTKLIYHFRSPNADKILTPNAVVG